MTIFLKMLVCTVALAAIPSGTIAQEAMTPGKPIPFLPVADEPAPELYVEPPLAGPLADRGIAIIPYRTANFRILAIFGSVAANVSPRAGHLHVSVDDSAWRWADAGDNAAVVVAGLPPGQHKVLIELATPEHKVFMGKAVTFVVPAMPAHHH
jgi:hypothetical protein